MRHQRIDQTTPAQSNLHPHKTKALSAAKKLENLQVFIFFDLVLEVYSNDNAHDRKVQTAGKSNRQEKQTTPVVKERERTSASPISFTAVADDSFIHSAGPKKLLIDYKIRSFFLFTSLFL